MRSTNRSRHRSRPRRKPTSPTPFSLALTAADARDMIQPLLDDILVAAAEVGERDDPLAAELFAAGLRASLGSASRLFMVDADRVLGKALVRAAEDAGRAGSLALLRAIEAAWPEPVSSRARSGADRLARSGVPAPSWADLMRRTAA